MERGNSISLAKLILILCIIFSVGTVFGIIGFLVTNKTLKTELPIVKFSEDKKITKSEIEKYLPAGYSVISDDLIYNEDVDSDGIKEIIMPIQKPKGFLEKLVILKPRDSGYAIVKTFDLDASTGGYFNEVSVKDINGDKIPEIIFTVDFAGSGETMPKEADIIEWNGKDYQVLLKKDMTLYSSGRPDTKKWIKKFIRDLKNDGNLEVIIPRGDSLYQAYCNYSTQGCVSLLKFDVYKWDGGKYINSMNEFPSVYNEEIKLADEFLKDPKIQKDSQEKITNYLKEINDSKEVANWKTYESKDYGFEFQYPNEFTVLNQSYKILVLKYAEGKSTKDDMDPSLGDESEFCLEIREQPYSMLESVLNEVSNVEKNSIDGHATYKYGGNRLIVKEKNKSLFQLRTCRLDSSDINIPDKILSTFKFTEETSAKNLSLTDIIMPRGVPEKYGKELNISFNSTLESINILKAYDQTFGNGNIKLAGEKLKRYTDIGQKIACEFCCSAKTLTFTDGKAACACAHSQAMRGLAAYLIDRHGSEYTDDEILRELTQWKVVYFPKEMVEKIIKEVNADEYSSDTKSFIGGMDTGDFPKLKESINNYSSKDIQVLPNQQGEC